MKRPVHICALVLIPFVVLNFDRQASAQNLISVDFEGDWGNWPDKGERSRAAFLWAVQYYERNLVFSTPITIKAIMAPIDSDTGGESLALKRDFVSSAPSWAVWFLPCYCLLPLYAQLTGDPTPAGQGDPYPEHAGYHAACVFNSEYEPSLDLGPQPYPWYFGPQGKPGYAVYPRDPPADPVVTPEHDFISVALHELAHAFGFAGSVQQDGSYAFPGKSSFDYAIGYDYYYPFWLLANSERADMLTYGTGYNGVVYWLSPGGYVRFVLSPFPDPPEIFYGGYVQMYTPYVWEPGSTYSHWTRSLGNAPRNFLMTPQQYNNATKRDTDITIDALADVGWQTNPYRSSFHEKWWIFAMTEAKDGAPVEEVCFLNRSSQNVTITDIWLEGTPDFSIDYGGTAPVTVLPFIDHGIGISFDPASPGYKQATLYIEYQASGTQVEAIALKAYVTGPDTDEDGMSDEDETRDLDSGTPGVQNPFDPEVRDATGYDGNSGPDYLVDGQNDWDADGMSNELEFLFGYNPIDANSTGQPTEADTDGDGLSDLDETSDWDPYTPGTQTPFDPYRGDAMGDNGSAAADGIPDGYNDWDGDSIANALELVYGTNPTLEDSDGDGVNDETESANDSNPNDPQSLPVRGEVWVDFAWQGKEWGTETFPLDTLAEALLIVADGYDIYIRGDSQQTSTPETGVLSRPMHLHAVGGSVLLGY